MVRFEGWEGRKNSSEEDLVRRNVIRGGLGEERCVMGVSVLGTMALFKKPHIVRPVRSIVVLNKGHDLWRFVH